MISPKKLIKLARKWQKTAALRRKRISLPRKFGASISEVSSTQSVTNKGHFVIYTTDHQHFTFPISYLSGFIFRELLRMSEEEFGLPSDGPITLPFDSVTMEYVISLAPRRLDEDTERALVLSLAANRCSFVHSLHQQQINQQVLICSF